MLRIHNLTKAYQHGGIPFMALQKISLEAKAGEVVCIIGPNGCGKSSLLKLVAGIEKPSTGTVVLEGSLAYVPQQSSLLPWRTVRQNIALPATLTNLDVDKKQIDQLLKQFGLLKFADHYPAALSGGMQQKVSLLRAIITKPDVLLLDEPFAWLDALTRRSMQQWLLKLWQVEKPTIICVTHDIQEALTLADTIYVMNAAPGKIIKKMVNPRVASTVQQAKLRTQLEGLLA